MRHHIVYLNTVIDGDGKPVTVAKSVIMDEKPKPKEIKRILAELKREVDERS